MRRHHGPLLRTTLLLLTTMLLTACADPSARDGGPPVTVGSAAPTAISPASDTVTAATTPAAPDPTARAANTTTVTATTATAVTAAPPATGTSCRERADGPEEHVYVERPGVDPAMTSLDLYLPAGCGPAPVVVWVHGGGWRTGDKRRSNTAQKAALVHEVGAALVAVDYRLSTPGSDVQWPDHGDDVATALAWIVESGPALGLDVSRIVLVGHSAGAHLVSILATDPALLASVGLSPSDIDGVIALDTDTWDLATSPAFESGLVTGAFGTDPEVLAAASPLLQIRDHGAPALPFLVVTRGSSARVDGAQGFVDALRASGGDATLVVAAGYSHADVNQRLGEPGETVVTPVVRTFLAERLAANGG